MLTSYPRDAFGDLTPDLREGSADADSGGVVSPGLARALGWLTIGLAVLLPLLAGALMGLLVWSRGRDEQYAGLTPGLTPGVDQQVPVVVGGPSPTVAVQFTPPAGVQPGMVGTILDEEVNLVDITSTLVDLAVRGHLQIARDDQGVFRADDWVLTRTAPPATAARPRPVRAAARSTRSSSGGDRIALSQLKNHFKPTLDAVERLMYEEVVQRGWFRRSPERQRSGWVGFGTFVLAGSVLFAFFGAGPAVGGLPGRRVPVQPGVAARRRRGRGRPADPGARQADGGAHRRGVGGPRPGPRLRAVHRDRRGQPDPVGGGRRTSSAASCPSPSSSASPTGGPGSSRRSPRRPPRPASPSPAPPGTSATGRPAASPTSPRAWTRSRRSPPAPSSPPRGPRGRAGSAAAGASPAVVAAARRAAAGSATWFEVMFRLVEPEHHLEAGRAAGRGDRPALRPAVTSTVAVSS